MAELAEVQPVKTAGFVNPRKSANQERIEKEEKELQDLVAQNKEEVTKTSKADNKEEAQEENLSKEEGSFKKRYGDLRRHMATKEKDFQSRIEALESQLGEMDLLIRQLRLRLAHYENT